MPEPTKPEAVRERLHTIIVDQLGVDPGNVRPEARFEEDLGADSLDCVELNLAVEEDFEIEIADEEAETVKTVQDAIDLIVRKLED